MSRYLMKKKSAFAITGVNLAYWFGALMYWELLLRMSVFGLSGAKMLYVPGFTAVTALIFVLGLSFVPRKGNFAANLVLSLAMTFLYGSQMVYNFVFGTLYSVSLMQQGGAAVTSFWKETLMTMWEELPWLALLLIPVAVLLVFRKKLAQFFAPSRWFCRCACAAAGVLLYVAMTLLLMQGKDQTFSDYYYYSSPTIATNITAERFGLITAFRLELVGSGLKAPEETYYVPPVETEPPETESETQPGETVPEIPQGNNVLDIDFAELSSQTDNKKRLSINEYCAASPGTNKNEYTGMLSDYNLIVLCAESFSSAAIHPEATPTLYKMANEGFVFENYYNTFPNTTTDGEYALLQGLYPDNTRGKGASTLYATRRSYLPFTLGNIFREQRGIESFGYHNYTGEYYGRDESHPNMGYTMKFAGDGMEFTNDWPASDLEMMEQSVDDYINREQFNVYYMTFSGHYMYNRSTNLMVEKNWSVVEDLPYSETCRAYLSCHVELDKALEYLLRRLEEAGIADKTAIVIAGDHYPYGLSDKQYSELIGQELDVFSKQKSSLIFWVGGMEEPVAVEEYCCNVDVLPTILNLWGFDFDSRMLAGTDVFSDGPHMAVLVDKSFATDKVYYQAGIRKAHYRVDESELPEGYLENMIQLVKTKFSISADIFNTAYYNYVFGKDEVKIDGYGWISN